MLSLLALESALEAFDGVSVAALRAKSMALGDLFIGLVDSTLDGLGVTVASPRMRAPAEARSRSRTQAAMQSCRR
jgi:kynureninase